MRACWVVGCLVLAGCPAAPSELTPSTGDASSHADGTITEPSGGDDAAVPTSVSTSHASSDGSAATDTGASFTEICDGSADLRLVARTGAPESNCPEAGLSLTQLYGMLGATYLYVRGDCRYWTFGPSLDALGSARTGVLDDAQAMAISQDLGYGAWPEMHGLYSESCLRTLSNLQSTIECGESCYWGTWAPPEIPDWLDEAKSWQAALYESGEPVPLTDPLRLHGWIADAAPSELLDGLVKWPFAFTPQDAGIPTDAPGREATWAVTDPDIVSALRSYWLGFDGAKPSYLEAFRFHVPGEPDRVVALWLRDALPFENADGYIPVPEPPLVPMGD